MDYLNNIKKLYEIKQNQGINVSDILQAEKHLKTTLPSVLKEYHQTLGLVDGINHVFNHILPLDKIDFAKDYLVIAEENQQDLFDKTLELNIDCSYISYEDEDCDDGFE